MGLVLAVNKVTVLFILSICIYGFCAFPIIPVIMELATRKFRKIPIYFTNTVLFVTSQLFSILLQLISGWAFDHFSSAGMAMFALITYLYLFSLYFVKDIDDEVE